MRRCIDEETPRESSSNERVTSRCDISSPSRFGPPRSTSTTLFGMLFSVFLEHQTLDCSPKSSRQCSLIRLLNACYRHDAI
jgi:hypothetical protein